MNPTTLSVFLDYKCNLACDHCSVGSSPDTGFEMEEEYLDRAFEQIDDLPTLEVVVFTGGEATLHWERLLDGISRASEKGYTTRIVTNGWWAFDMENAYDTLDKLVAAGLDELNTSYDDFHTEYIEVDRVLNLIEAGMEYDELESLAMATIIGHEDPEYDRERIVNCLDERLDRHPKEYDRLTLLEDTAAPMGRGAQLDVADLKVRNNISSGCNDVIHTVSLHPDGSVKACCGHAQWYVPDLTLGNIAEETLPEIVERSQGNLVYWLIHEVGPKRLLERMGIENEHSGICHACFDLLNNYREEFLDYVRENREELIVEELYLGDDVKENAEEILKNKEDLLERLEAVEHEPSSMVSS